MFFFFFFKRQNLFRNINPNVTAPLLQRKASLAVVILSAYIFRKQVHKVLTVICDVGATGEADRETEYLPGWKKANKDERKLISLDWYVVVSLA